MKYIFVTIFFITCSSVSLAEDNEISACEKKLSDLVRIIETEFNRGPVTRETPIFFGLFTWSIETYNVLQVNRIKVQKSVPIINCSNSDLEKSAYSTNLIPNPFFKNGEYIVISFDTEHKNGQFSWNSKTGNITHADLHVKKPLLE